MYGPASITKSLAHKYPGVRVGSDTLSDTYFISVPGHRTFHLMNVDLVRFKSEAELLAWVAKQLEAKP